MSVTYFSPNLQKRFSMEIDTLFNENTQLKLDLSFRKNSKVKSWKQLLNEEVLEISAAFAKDRILNKYTITEHIVTHEIKNINKKNLQSSSTSEGRGNFGDEMEPSCVLKIKSRIRDLEDE